MPCSLEKRSSPTWINVVNISICHDQLFTYRKVLLHACQRQGILTSIVFYPWTCAESEQQLDDLEVAIDGSLHETCGVGIVSLIDIEPAIKLISFFLGLLLRLAPVYENILNDILVPS
jgi:hypothetical protein